MSSTPPKKEGVEPAQSPDEEQPMDRNAEETQAQGLGYEFEVKEQDRWLPIANGTSASLASSLHFDLRSLPSHLHVDGLLSCASLMPACLQSRVSASNHGFLQPSRASQNLCVPGKRPSCSHHVVFISTVVYFPATIAPQEHKQ